MKGRRQRHKENRRRKPWKPVKTSMMAMLVSLNLRMERLAEAAEIFTSKWPVCLKAYRRGDEIHIYNYQLCPLREIARVSQAVRQFEACLTAFFILPPQDLKKILEKDWPLTYVTSQHNKHHWQLIIDNFH